MISNIFVFPAAIRHLSVFKEIPHEDVELENIGDWINRIESNGNLKQFSSLQDFTQNFPEMQKISEAEQYLLFCYFYGRCFWKVTVQPSSNASADVALKVTPMNRSFGDSPQHSFDDLDIHISDDDANSVINDRIVTLPDFGLSDDAPVTNTGVGSDTELEFLTYFTVPGQKKSAIEKNNSPRLAQVTQQSIITPKTYHRITTNSNRAEKRHATIESPRIRKSLINKADSHLRNTSVKADSRNRSKLSSERSLNSSPQR